MLMSAGTAQLDLATLRGREGVGAPDLERVLEMVRRAQEPARQLISVREETGIRELVVERRGVGPITNEFGLFWSYDIHVDDQWRNYVALVRAESLDKEFRPVFRMDRPLLVRPDSGCGTGQMYLDNTCDCREQLCLAMRLIRDEGEGVLISIPAQDGRGMGLGRKLGTLWLQSALGVHTVDAGLLLADDNVIDSRTYGGAVAVLKSLGVAEGARLLLAVNNPQKVATFAQNGFRVERRAVSVPPTEHTRRHLEAKERLLGHAGLVS
jgi:GTP cyclohydrolase II